MEIFTVSLFGHRYIENPDILRSALKPIVQKLVQDNIYIQFLIGHDGMFDEIAADVISETIRNSPYHTAMLIMVLPYMRSEFQQKENFQQYNQITICPFSADVRFQNAFLVRNMEMIQQSDMIICYLLHSHGGTFHAVQYANKKGRKIINLHKMQKQHS